MATTKQINRALTRIERLRAQQEELERKAREADEQLTILVGSAVREAVESETSAWHQHVELSVRDFYSLVTESSTDETETNETAPAVGESESRYEWPSGHEG